MSTLMDGINNAYAISAQINALRALERSGSNDPEAVKYALEQNFNQMLDGLVSAADDEDKEEKSDPFSFYVSGYQESLQGLQARGILEDTGAAGPVPDMSSPEYLYSLYNLGQLY